MESTLSDRITIDVHLDEGGAASERQELAAALGEHPPRIPSRYFYDEKGSRLFEEITRLPEYYLTRAETALLRRLAEPIAEHTGATDLVELGSGAAVKTRTLLDAMRRRANLARYVPFDVDEAVVRRTAAELAVTYPGLEVHGVVGDFRRHLELVPAGGRRLVAFLGSTVGNLTTSETVAFLGRLSAIMSSDDAFLLGVDLVKDPARLEAAYNDPAGLTAAFNRNVLAVLNRRFGADFEPRAFAHRAFFDRERERIEMRLVSRREQRVRVAALDLALELERGDELLTEISTKYRRERVIELLNAGGFDLARWWSDPEGLFALALARPAAL